MKEKKINGNLKEEFTSLEDYKNEIKKDLEMRKKRSVVFWITLTVILMIVNIATIVVASLGLNVLLTDNKGTTASIAPIIGVVVLVISAFVLSLVITIYQGVMRAKWYKSASERIQEETLVWYAKADAYSKDNANEKFEEKINEIIGEALTAKTNFSFKKGLLKILSGGNYE